MNDFINCGFDQRNWVKLLGVTKNKIHYRGNRKQFKTYLVYQNENKTII